MSSTRIPMSAFREKVRRHLAQQGLPAPLTEGSPFRRKVLAALHERARPIGTRGELALLEVPPFQVVAVDGDRNRITVELHPDADRALRDAGIVALGRRIEAPGAWVTCPSCEGAGDRCRGCQDAGVIAALRFPEPIRAALARHIREQLTS